MRAEERWQSRFRAPRMTLPVCAGRAPHRAVYQSNASGSWEIYAWDRSTGASRQVTARPNGTRTAVLDPTGQWIWWFADTDGDEWGEWMRQPFGGGPDEPAVAAPAGDGIPYGHPAGIGLSAVGTAAIGLARPGRGFQILHVSPGEAPTVIYEHAEAAYVTAMSPDGSLISINHSEHGDALHPALRVVRPNGSTVGDLRDAPGKGLIGARFSPVHGDRRLLVLHERRGRREPLLWDPVTGDQREVYLRDPGEVGAEWFEDARSLLIIRQDRGRTRLHRYDLGGGGMTPIDTPHGVIEAAAARHDGAVEYAWSSSSHPPVIRSSAGNVVMNPPGPSAPPSVPVEDFDVEGPGGRVHALVSRPERGAGPYPTVFMLHGGPTSQDNDSFLPGVAAWVDYGFAVVRVNYRGSTGYGSAWRDALRGDVGHIELADVTAVREHLVAHGVADPARLVVAGRSWGGYLTLLALGVQPKVWAAGIAAVPIADHVATYEDETEGLRAYQRALLGGSPDDVPERYASCSPITYVDQVEAPVLILAGENDPRCPIRQVTNYIDRLAGREHDHEVYRYDAGHGTLVVAEQIEQMAAQLDFARKRLGLSG
ncbi:prolyl oligopeptidase family serine peptidase [Spongiactinospora sp. TRM90649]|uniref:S9 family peptidase n=1 Tax=Spongiactinospora sp. TRM90649 TaxID=3031114 RepID=UPI0023F968A6|nr:prolyl oligopeptidase family serine peptidase [Spongiactinospora sp. TRM90649]MDF5757488.1 prolyl oligopeptidase family serine peptidase [Spongiactinospora sp. TRM90649]